MTSSSRKPTTRELEFAGFRLNVLRRQLRGPDGAVMDLPARAFDSLVYLIAHRGEDISKDQIMKAVWADTIVEENNLNQAIYSLRRALGDSASEPRFIMTLPGRGYRFVADVDEAPTTLAPPRRQRLVALGIAMLLATVVLGWVLWPTGKILAAPATLAVLPFKALLPDQSNPALELGMTNSLITQLSGIQGIKVSSLSSVRSFGAPTQDPFEAGKSLAVDYVLESYVVREGERIRVTTRLLRVRDGQSLWPGKFDEPFSDILEVQDSIAERVTETLAPHLSATATELNVRRTENAEAFELYTEAFYNQQRRDKNGLPDAVKFYEAALLLDPGYVDAWGGLSRTLAVQGVLGSEPPLKVFPRAKEAALKALELDPDSAQAHAAMAHVMAVYDRQFKLADEHYTIAKRLDPTVPEFYLLSSLNKANLGRMEDALGEARHAIDLVPESLLFHSNLGLVLYLNRSYEEAERELRRVLELQPNFALARGVLAQVLIAKDDYQGALALVESGRAYALLGRKQEAIAEIGKLIVRGAQGFAVNYEIASIRGALGEKRAACESLAAAVADGVSYVGFMQLDPALDPLRTEPCFAELTRRVYNDPHR